MRTIDGLEMLTRPVARSVVAIGKFDGVHRGHQALIRAGVKRARQEAAESVVVTFDRNPIELLRPGSPMRYLTSLDQRLRLIAELGVDTALVIHLSLEFLSLSPEEFVRSVLLERLGMVGIVAIDGFRFGRAAAGTVETLRELGLTYGYCVEEVQPLIVDGGRVSSSRIRQSILAGRFDEAARLLGRPWHGYQSNVAAGEGFYPYSRIEGDRRGRLRLAA
jgi:riboflavin kinase / FMN adenylyltransferase